MMPVSTIDAASEPASGLVRPKQGMSRPSASRGNHLSCCSLVPKRINSSPGPSEFGTITVTAAVIERVESFLTTSECAKRVEGAIEERPFLIGQRSGRLAQQLRPIGIAGEEIGVPPDVAGLERFA